MNTKVWTILQILTWTAQYFEESGIQNPRLDAEVLLAHALKTNRLSLYLNYDKPLKKDELRLFKRLIQRRKKREPLQYITECQEFWSLKLKVKKGVLIPRSETEILVEEVLKTFPVIESSHTTINILELGTGSGAIAVSLAHELQRGWIFATDISDVAIGIAKENARNHGVEGYITFQKGNLFDPVQKKRKLFQIVLSNPPYIKTDDFEGLQPEIRDFEPRTALDGGKDGLGFYRQILHEVGMCLANEGWLMLEVGMGQAEEVVALIHSQGEFCSVSMIKDLSGTERVVKAQKKGALAKGSP